MTQMLTARLLVPAVAVAIVIALATAIIATPATTLAATADRTPIAEQASPEPFALANPAFDSEGAMPECPLCWFGAGVIVTLIVAVIDNPDGPIATVVNDAVSFVANAYESACNSSACVGPYAGH